MAERSPWTVAIAALVLVAPLLGAPRAAAAETVHVDAVSPLLGFAIFDFGRSDKLRKKLTQAERRQAEAEARAHAAEQWAKREHAAFEAEHAAREREHAAYEREHIAYERAHAAYEQQHGAYERELATIAAYRRQADAQRDRLARLTGHNVPARAPVRIAPRRPATVLLAAAPLHRNHGSPAFHAAAKKRNAAPARSAAQESRPGVTSTRSVGWGKI